MMEIQENVMFTAPIIQQNGFIKVEKDSMEIEKIYKEYEETIASQSQLIDTLKARIEELETDSMIKSQDIKRLRNEFDDFKNKIQSILAISLQDNKMVSLLVNEEKPGSNNQLGGLSNMEICTDSCNENLRNEKESKKFCFDSDEFFNTPNQHSENRYNDYVQHDQKDVNRVIHAKITKSFDKLKNETVKVNDQTIKELRNNFSMNQLLEYEKSSLFKSLNCDPKNYIKFSINDGLKRELSENICSVPVEFQNAKKCDLFLSSRKRSHDFDFIEKSKRIRFTNNY